MRGELSKALLTVLKINYHFKIVNLEIRPHYVEWHFAVAFKNDPQCKWHPKRYKFIDETRKLEMTEGLLDNNPIIVDAATILYMAEARLQQPPPKLA